MKRKLQKALIAAAMILFGNSMSFGASDTLCPFDAAEVWSYLIVGEESSYVPGIPVTDLCYFGIEINEYGEVENPPSRFGIPKTFKGRTHLVITSSSRSLSHFILDPNSDTNKKMVADLIDATKNFDGLQIDFEYVPKRDEKNFKTFLKHLRKGLSQDQMLTVCVPARTKKIPEDVYDYEDISPYVDRVFVMAYDQHWSTSEPGPVAANDWCQRIADYAVTAIPQEKLIMGMPFYGRSWQNESFGKAWRYKTVRQILSENKTVAERTQGIPKFRFKKTVTVTGWYDDTTSLLTKCKIYSDRGVNKIGFWRIGQEDKNFWKYITIPE